jgi:hypothetical protein
MDKDKWYHKRKFEDTAEWHFGNLCISWGEEFVEWDFCWKEHNKYFMYGHFFIGWMPKYFILNKAQNQEGALGRIVNMPIVDALNIPVSDRMRMVARVALQKEEFPRLVHNCDNPHFVIKDHKAYCLNCNPPEDV